jgi:hypothetical protein
LDVLRHCWCVCGGRVFTVGSVEECELKCFNLQYERFSVAEFKCRSIREDEPKVYYDYYSDVQVF